MNKKDLDRVDAINRVNNFGTENSADFPAGSRGAQLFAELTACLALINQHSINQSSAKGASRQEFVIKDTARQTLRRLLIDISRASKAVNYEIPGTADKFRLPVNHSNANLLIAARVFLEDALPIKAKLIEYELPADILDRLETAIEDFEASLSSTHRVRNKQVSATAEIRATLRRAAIAMRQLGVAVRNKYKNNAGMLAAWATASHIVRDNPKDSQPPQATP